MRNLGILDRLARLVAGLVIVALPFLFAPGSWASWGLFVVGGVLIATAAFAFCPLYAALGLSTGGRLHGVPPAERT